MISKAESIAIKMERIFKVFWKYFWLLGLIPIYLYFKNISIYATNIPHWDDYAIINFLKKFNATSSFFEKTELLFAQHNEHRIAFTRLIALLIFWVKGSFDFRWMIWLGNLALIGILFLFYGFLKRNRLSINYLVPICFLLFQFSLFENSYWGMASVQNFWVILFILIAIWQISSGVNPYLAMFFATFTSGNGLVFLVIIGVIIFLFKRNYSALIKFVLYSLLLLISYFWFYTKLPDNKAISLNLFENLKAVFLLLGSFFDFKIYAALPFRVQNAQIAGILIFILAALIFCSKYLKKRKLGVANYFNLYFLLGAFLFVLGTASATSLARLQYGEFVFLTSKYRIYSILLVIIIYISILLNYRYLASKLILFFAIIFSVFVFVNTYFYFIGEIKNYYNTENANYYNAWHLGHKTDENNTKPYYTYQKTIFDNTIAEDSSLKNSPIGKVTILENALRIENKNFETTDNSAGDGPYLEFIGAGSQYFFAVKQEIFNNKKAYFLGKSNYFSSGFTADIPLTEIPTGNYFVNIVKYEAQILTRIPRNYYIEILGKEAKKSIQNW